ncbi:transglycosylase domain-containing protein [Angustibacter luteus]|uniref:Transglycosylase domain-containing protein n=1 Tax=Angustibacter luteus TaxID=658456 RepID=A0ABW1JE42_9ACTN
MTMRTDDRGSGFAGIIALLAAFIGTALVAGLIGAGLFMPSVGAAGATARSGVEFFDALPTEFEQSPLAQQSRILDADDHVIATFYNENRIVVPLKKVAMIMQNAQIAIEDTRFREHGGIDPKGVLRAAVSNAQSGESGQGASTLTQQFVKLTLQENALSAGDEEGALAAVDKNFGRKLQEMKYAITLEKNMTKDEILQGYLNIAYYGDGAYGVETAARHYFSTTAAKLTLPQAAMLAGLVQQPGRFDPRKNPKAALARRNIVLDRMLQTKVITQKQHDAAVKTKIGLKVRPAGNGCDTSPYPYFCDYIYNQVLDSKTFGPTTAARRALMMRGGLTIKTTLQPAAQKQAQKAVSSKVAPTNKSKVAAAMSVVEPGTGKVLAMVQSTRYGRTKGKTTVNYNVDKTYNGGSGFQTGSTFKAFTLAAALDDGQSLNSIVDAPPGKYKFQRSEFKPGSCEDLRPSNYDPGNSEGHERGPMTLADATAHSVNTAFVRLEAEVGICKVADIASNLGVHLAQPSAADQPDGKPSSDIRPYGSLTLGIETIAPLTMASAYAAFAADGQYCPPVSITSATTLGGKKIALPKSACDQAIKEDVARGVTSALQGVLTHGTAAGRGIGRPAAGKTGTTNNSTDLWFIGYTPQLAAAVWFGHPNASKPMKNINTGKGSYGGQLYGATVSAPIWQSFMKAASAKLAVENFGKPSSKMTYGERITVPSVTGQSIEAATRTLEGAGFSVSVGAPKPSAVPAGQVAESSPGAGSRATAGTTVTIYPSTGVPPATPNQPGPGNTPNPTITGFPNPNPTHTRKPR